MSCVCESFCMKYDPKHNTFAFDEQYNDLLHASILISMSSSTSLSHEAPPHMPSSSSHELKPLPDALNMLSWVLISPIIVQHRIHLEDNAEPY